MTQDILSLLVLTLNPVNLYHLQPFLLTMCNFYQIRNIIKYAIWNEFIGTFNRK